jgi:DAACS family dicarboxylate/amino acid:cation (Na+ or H+) symporter
MSESVPQPPAPGADAASPWIVRLFAAYNRVPLYVRILAGMLLGVAVGLTMFAMKASAPRGVADTAWVLNKVSAMVIQFLAALAPPLILLAVMRALITARIEGRQGAYMVFLLALNTLVAIGIGLLVANVVQPGRFASLSVKPGAARNDNILEQLLDNIPKSLVEPFVTGRVIGVVILALVFGFAARKLVEKQQQLLLDLLETGFEAILIVLHWIIWLVPLAVFAKVGATLAGEGVEPFIALGVFVLAVLLALFLQAVWYLSRIRWRSWVSPLTLLRQTRDALVMAFSTGSSTATMPVTYQRLRVGVGLRERSASLGSLVGSNFNNDGTALYEAMAALFIAQMIPGLNLTFGDQLMIVLTSVIASVGAAGIPEAGLVTMTLVFKAVNLDPSYIPLLLPVDWFLDRCRTAINVMGDMNVACLLDGKEREAVNSSPTSSDVSDASVTV